MSVVLLGPALVLFPFGLMAESWAMKIGAGAPVAVMTGGFMLNR
jgi:hypothetical protein